MPVLACLPRIDGSQWADATAVHQRQLQRLDELVRHFRSADPVYERLLRAAGADDVKIRDEADLVRLPILERSHLRELADGIRQRGRGRHPRFSVRLTGGSTGAPAAVLIDPAASAMSLAARVICQRWHGLELGHRQVRLWGRPPASGHLRASLKDWLLNRMSLDSLALEPPQLARSLARVSRFGPEYLYGYTSLIQLFAERIPSGQLAGILHRLMAAVCTSETMLAPQQAQLERALGCPVVEEYGCSEVDIIAYQCPAGGRHVVGENVLVETHRDGDEPDGYGQVLVTDLNNRVMPIIRYRLGDLAPLERPRCSCGRGWPCLGPVLGRSQGQYIQAPGRGLVHSQMVVYLVERLVAKGVGISRFKIIQDEVDHLRIALVPSDQTSFDLAGLGAFFRREGQAVLGPDMTWTVEQTTSEMLERGRINKFQHFESRIVS